MRNNKAVRQNRNFMTLTVTLGLLVLGVVGFFWYLAFDNGNVAKESSSTTETAASDSLCEIILLDETGKTDN